LLRVIAPALPLRHFIRRAAVMACAMTASRSTRPMQMSIARKIFERSLG
jgi:hypothetical protein